jgi:hypothetical protein
MSSARYFAFIGILASLLSACAPVEIPEVNQNSYQAKNCSRPVEQAFNEVFSLQIALPLMSALSSVSPEVYETRVNEAVKYCETLSSKNSARQYPCNFKLNNNELQMNQNMVSDICARIKESKSTIQDYRRRYENK